MLASGALALGCGGAAGSSAADPAGGDDPPAGDPTLALAPGIPDAAGQAALVAAHNQVRRGALSPTPDPELPLLTWDPLLAQVASAWAQRCQSSGGALLDHNAGRTSDYAALGGSGYVGENIMASTGTITVGGAVGAWAGEASAYTYSTNGCSGTCGHYTQLVWRATLRVGCAVSRCAGLGYPNTLVCDYAPGGNYVGQRPY